MTRRKVIKPDPEELKHKSSYTNGYIDGFSDHAKGVRNPTICTDNFDETAPRVPIQEQAQVSGLSNQNFAIQNAFLGILQKMPVASQPQMMQSFLQLTPEQQAIFIQQYWR